MKLFRLFDFIILEFNALIGKFINAFSVEDGIHGLILIMILDDIRN